MSGDSEGEDGSLREIGRLLEGRAGRDADRLADHDPGLESLRTQGGATVNRLRSRKRLDIHVVEDADHTFTDRRARARLVDILTEKLQGSC